HRPVAFDLNLCTILGMGVKKLFDEGKSGCIVTTTRAAEVIPLYLNDIEDENGKIPPRLVDIDNEFSQMVLSDMHVVTIQDYEKARKWINIPETYDFYRILEWDHHNLLHPLRPGMEE
ncbi:MAG: hypothetical protein KJO50_10780, partial [Bacteroidia bacterium]|nr:hypothetical protein [Bacteroidia bacterium]